MPAQDVGDWSVPKLIVAPFDGTTSATVRVYAPDGTLFATPIVSGTDDSPESGKKTWIAAAYQVTAGGVWREEWTVAGTGAGVEDRRFYVSPATVEPVWSPPPWKPADYVPNRTLVPVDTGANAPVNSFDSTTRPNGTQVERLTTDACAWVMLATGEVHASLYEAASAAAAIWVASAIEDAFPDSNADSSSARAASLLRRAESMRTSLQAANEAATGTDTTDSNAGLLPTYSFPPPVPWGDTYL